MNVVSLLPSATEVCYALGIEPVGVSHECDHPPAAREQPTVVHSRIDDDATAGEIDRQVLEAERAGGVYELDVDTLRRVDPDLIVTQGVCEVCAVDRVLVHDAVERFDLDCEVLTTDPHSLADVFEDIERVGAAVGRAERAATVVAELRDRVAAVRRRTPDPAAGPQVTVLDWTDPIMTAGHWVEDLVTAAGGRFDLAAPASTPREWAEIRAADPDVLVVAPCGFDLEQTAANLDDLTERPGWAALTAVREDRAYVVDGHQYLNRPGPRLVDSLEILAALFHPARFEAPAPTAARPLSTLAPGETASETVPDPDAAIEPGTGGADDD